MRRGRIFLLLALIIVVGLALAYFVFSKGLLNPQPAGTTVPELLPTATPIPSAKVVVVVQRVERGEILTAEKLDVVDYQADLVLPIMYTDVTQVEGKMARYSMDPYTVVTSAMVTSAPDTEQGSDDALFISPGMVAISIPVSRLSSVSYAPTREIM